MNDPGDISRRDLLRGRVGSRRSPPASGAGLGSDSQRRVPLPVHRPPGAAPEAEFLAGCTRCGACVDACPVDAIVLAPPRFREAAGTPMIDAHTTACVMCADTPCIASCEPDVLRAGRPLKMGTAWIDRMNCLAWTGSFCTVCSERCPVPGAITLEQGRPIIVESVCTGCGVCHGVCPAPVNAVGIMPLPDRTE
ncbi:MAG TPA: 4Fe-4S dicluster domain-containing protein [Phycisphaerales bacterium]|nr:4Fe-4S dicluster domain-containing protein [Phycisphaerales bacterium]